MDGLELEQRHFSLDLDRYPDIGWHQDSGTMIVTKEEVSLTATMVVGLRLGTKMI